ncbi:hypothetical protein GOP47_0031210, partial [Adiantum capillus-veneris]
VRLSAPTSKRCQPVSRAPDIPPVNLAADRDSIMSASTGQQRAKKQHPDRRPKNNEDSNSNESSSSDSTESSSSDSTESSSTGLSITEEQAIRSSADLQELDKIPLKMPAILCCCLQTFWRNTDLDFKTPDGYTY